MNRWVWRTTMRSCSAGKQWAGTSSQKGATDWHRDAGVGLIHVEDVGDGLAFGQSQRGDVHKCLHIPIPGGTDPCTLTAQPHGFRQRNATLCRPSEISGRHCVRGRNALHCHALRPSGNTMAAAERMRAMRERRQARGLRELRLVVPDARSKAIRRRIAREVAGLDRARELAALGWIEAVSEFDRG
jgi:hypothetical protein